MQRTASTLLGFTCSALIGLIPISVHAQWHGFGADAEPDTSFVSAHGSVEIHVQAGAALGGTGSEAAPFRTIGEALDAAEPGTTIVVHAGVYEEHLASTVDGQADAPVRLQAAPGDAVTLRAVGDQALVALRHAYWIVEGLEIDMDGHRNHAVRFQGARSSALIGCDVHHATGGSTVAVYGGAEDVLIERNTIHHSSNSLGGQPADSHGILVVPDAQRVMIRNNDVYENTGDAFQCAGRAQGNPGDDDPHDIILEDNRFHDNRENAVDIKSCRAITVRGGPLDESKFYGHGESSTARGEGVVIHYEANDVLVTRTRLWNNCIGVTIGRADDDRHLTRDVAVLRNLFFEHRGVTDVCRGNGVQVNRARNVQIAHNTFDGMPNAAIRVGPGDSISPFADQVRVWNNIVRDAHRWLDIGLDRAPMLRVDRNIYWDGAGESARIRLDGAMVDLAAWQAASGLDETSIYADPGFTDTPHETDYVTSSSSPARDSAIDDVGDVEVCGAGPDIGFVETCDAPPADDGGMAAEDDASVAPGPDGGTSARSDGGASARTDGGVAAMSGGCGCRITGGASEGWGIALMLAFGLARAARRRRPRVPRPRSQ